MYRTSMSPERGTGATIDFTIQRLVVNAVLGSGALLAPVIVAAAGRLMVRRLKLEVRLLLGHDVERPDPIEQRLANTVRTLLRRRRNKRRLRRFAPIENRRLRLR